MHTVYIDQFIIINIVLNYILLFVTKKVIHSESSNPRLFLGSVIGALYAAFMFMPNTKYLYSFVGKLIFSLVLIAITYNIKNIKVYLRAVGVFYLISFIFGGSAFAVMNFMNGGSSSAVTFKILISSTVIAYICLTLISAYYKRYVFKESNFANLKIVLNDKWVDIKCLIDTGNALYEPLTNIPVLVVECRSIYEILPKDICSVIENKMPFDDILSAFSKYNLSTRFRLIPFNSVGTSNGIIVGFRPDKTFINDKIVAKCIIGLYTKSLSSDNSYYGLINPQIFA